MIPVTYKKQLEMIGVGLSVPHNGENGIPFPCTQGYIDISSRWYSPQSCPPPF